MSELKKYQVGDKLIINCSDISYEGLGVSRLNNYAIFTSNLFPDEQAQVTLSKVTSKYAFATVDKLIKVSPYRNKNQYDCYNSAPLINLNYQQQIEFKNNYFKTLLSWNLGNEILQVYKDFSPSLVITNYRNKVRYPLIKQDHKLVLGEYDIKSNDLHIANNYIQNMHIINQCLDEVLAIVNNYLESNKKKNAINFYNEIIIRANQDNKVSLAMDIHSDYDIPNSIIESIKDIEYIVDFNIIKKHKVKNIFTKEEFVMQIANKEFICNINSFFQININVAQNIFKQIKEYISKSFENIILDAYCGVGTIGQLVASDHKVIGSDIVQSAIINANRNKEINQVQASYFVGDSATIFKKQIKDLTNTFLILDPPRSGITPQFIHWIKQNKIKNIIYMSCDVKTLVRDLKELNDLYEIKSIQGFDMFPNTAHIEALSILKIK
ncbi:23S rRNA (uracil(1939)-C(5))-methyltransferase RlmD [Mycoplasmopsis verecunda]|uniref:23S rRNA (Uracil1939-C5)-methyltransferase n=1 Tax=Mycoplasmopsis verecunda TaxID=171291 RepID=A0A1T4KXM6_9BACT|nr:23S rRNA (uracil(1939)-C(5))-methyltransferase RlmD [Mycoplasmopsis verecunda]WPB54327.1 23S rRNA (uracil(1939)-C(5))-methyltransferase RlmD [Mycoplasmopsis verecunda]SJZ47103.1 23S rRNA (uracil1939-C5)-methyltransferase [Mycoplasmopsis verecunda]